MVKKKFYVITSLTEEELARVNVLDIGGIGLPENFLITQVCFTMYIFFYLPVLPNLNVSIFEHSDILGLLNLKFA